ncbi:MAG: hypothetical protein RBT65_15660 [Methanolobus sp.]|nr:hypothetical protein [Methanolobus sp.]
MTKKQKQNLIQGIKYELASYGFVEDSYGNFVNSDKSVRYKFAKTCLRREHSYRNHENKLMWKRFSSGYYSALSLDELGRLHGLTR